nr:SOS response-associated peptidase [Microvirga sp. HBU65207]
MPVHITEYKDTKPRKTPVWFALSRDQPLAAFAGIWRLWTGVRGTKAEPAEGEHLLYAFLTSEPNGVVGPIHPKAMPVILTTRRSKEPGSPRRRTMALKLHRPLPDDMLKIVAEGAKSDQPEGA